MHVHARPVGSCGKLLQACAMTGVTQNRLHCLYPSYTYICSGTALPDAHIHHLPCQYAFHTWQAQKQDALLPTFCSAR